MPSGYFNKELTQSGFIPNFYRTQLSLQKNLMESKSQKVFGLKINFGDRGFKINMKSILHYTSLSQSVKGYFNVSIIT